MPLAKNRQIRKQANCLMCIVVFQKRKHDRSDRVYVGLYDYFIATHFPRKNLPFVKIKCHRYPTVKLQIFLLTFLNFYRKALKRELLGTINRLL